MTFDPLTIIMIVVLLVLVFFMFRSSRRRRQQAQDLQKQVVPGASVMTNFGLFGTVISIDEETNKVELETSPGQILTVHRQTVTRVETPTVEENGEGEKDEKALGEAPADPTVDGVEPEYGERVNKDSDGTPGSKAGE